MRLDAQDTRFLRRLGGSLIAAITVVGFILVSPPIVVIAVMALVGTVFVGYLAKKAFVGQGWVRLRKSRTYQLVDTEMQYWPDPDVPGALYGRMVATRTFTALVPNATFSISTTTRHDDLLRGKATRNPWARLEACQRSDRADGIALASKPYRLSGNSFGHNVEFDPPLPVGATATIRYVVDIPTYKYANRTDLFEDSNDGRDHTGFVIAYSTDRFVRKVFFPRSVKANDIEPLRLTGDHPVKNRNDSEFMKCWKDEEASRIDPNGSERVPGRLYTLDVPRPVVGSTYRIRWMPGKTAPRVAPGRDTFEATFDDSDDH